MPTPAPNRNAGTQLISTSEGSLGGYPEEFRASTVSTETKQTGIALNESLPIPDGTVIIENDLVQDKTDERTLLTKTANFAGISLTQQITDPIYGISALVTKSIVPTLGGVYRATITNGGSGYSIASATSPAPPGGLAAQYHVNIQGGIIHSIDVTDPGSGYSIAPVITITGNGTGATATASIPVIPGTGSGVEGITSLVGGTSYTHATATVPAPTNGVAAILLPVIVAGVITSISIINTGTGYATAPTITITGDGTGASATAVLGWNTFYDRDPLNKWKSIQIASKIDRNTLPSTLILPKMQRLALPDVLQSVSGQWTTDKGVSQTESGSSNPSISGTATCTQDGGINVQIKSGFRGDAKGQFIRTFFSALPSQSDLPTPTIILPSLGTAVVGATGQSVSASYTLFSASGSFSTQIRAHSISIGPLMTNSVSPSNLTHTDSQNVSDSISGGPLDASYNITANSTGTITLSLPASTPAAFSSGDAIILDGEVTQWRFGIYVLEYNKAFVP